MKVPEPSVDETYQILLGLRERYEAHHKLTYTDEALQAAAKFSSQYISDRFLPDKVIKLLNSCPLGSCNAISRLLCFNSGGCSICICICMVTQRDVKEICQMLHVSKM